MYKQNELFLLYLVLNNCCTHSTIRLNSLKQPKNATKLGTFPKLVLKVHHKSKRKPTFFVIRSVIPRNKACVTESGRFLLKVQVYN